MPDPPPPPVQVQVVTLTERSPVVRATAPVEAERRATLRTETAGKVMDAPFRAGAQVERGQVILRLDGPRTAVAVKQARARVSQARASLRQLTRNRENAEKLEAQNANTRNVVEAARDRESEAQARLTEAEAGLRSAQAGVSETIIRAPFAGVLADFRVNEGEFLAPGAEVAVLVDRTSIEAELLLDPVEAADARVEARVTVWPAALAERSFEGRVSFVGEVLDPRTRRLPVRVSISDPKGELKPGGVATFEIDVGEPRPIAVVPERAVVRRMGQTQVFIVDGTVAQTRDIRLGSVRDGQAEVVDGLASDDRVVVDGIERVVAGRPVRIVTAVAARDPEDP